MKEFIERYDPTRQGLNPEQLIDLKGFKDAFDVRVTETGFDGISYYQPDFLSHESLYTDNNIAIDIHSPQVFEILGAYYLLTQNKMYIIGDSSITAVSLYDAYTETETNALSNGRWKLASIGNRYIFVNGRSTIFNKYDIQKTMTWYVENTVVTQSVADFKGHIFKGGFASDNFFNNKWKKYMSQASRVGINYDIDEDTILWTSVNAGDLLWHFYPSDVFTTAYGHSNQYDFYNEWLFRGDSGQMSIPNLGGIKAIHKSANRMFIYGTFNSVVCDFIVDPIPSLAVIDYLGFGIKHRGTLDGNSLTHFLISNTNELIRVFNGEVQKLGYSKYFDDPNTVFTITYNEKRDEVYISGEYESFLYSKGLTQLSNKVPAVFHKDNIETYIYR